MQQKILRDYIFLPHSFTNSFGGIIFLLSWTKLCKIASFRSVFIWREPTTDVKLTSSCISTASPSSCYLTISILGLRVVWLCKAVLNATFMAIGYWYDTTSRFPKCVTSPLLSTSLLCRRKRYILSLFFLSRDSTLLSIRGKFVDKILSRKGVSSKRKKKTFLRF